MQLDSYLELFTTMYGWAFANIIGEIITGTGLAALPFALIVFNAWREAKEQGMGFNGVLSLLESVQTKLYTALFVMSVCFATTPITSLHKINLSFTPAPTLEQPNPQPVSQRSGTNSTFDKAMGDASSGSMSSAGNLSYVPAWWYATMGISSGINQAFRAGLNNSGNELRMVEEIARTAAIEDPKLLASIQRFYSECFIPARSQYLRTPKSSLSASGLALIDQRNTDYGPTDVDWMGSQLFRTEPGYYSAMRSYNPVPGWAIDFSRDTDYIQTPAPEGTPEHGYVNPDWGRPTCKQWWEDGSQGIRQAMINHSSTWRVLATKATQFLSSDDKAKDAAAKLAVTQAAPQYVSPDAFFGAQHGAGTVAMRTVGGVVSAVGTGMMALVTNITVVPLHNGLLMMQAMVLMALYMFLPMVTFLSGYDLKTMFLGALAIFTVKFWSVMWYIVNWIDGHMMEAMYPSGSFDVDFLVQMLQNSNKGMLLKILLISMYVGMPMIWTGLMAMIGHKSIGQIDSLTRASKTADGATPRKLR